MIGLLNEKIKSFSFINHFFSSSFSSNRKKIKEGGDFYLKKKFLMIFIH